jgi:hypothetical protein
MLLVGPAGHDKVRLRATLDGLSGIASLGQSGRGSEYHRHPVQLRLSLCADETQALPGF